MFIKRVASLIKERIYFNSKTLLKHKITRTKVFLHLGKLMHEVTVVENEKLEDDVIGIPHSLFDQITLPEDIEFDWYMEGSHFVVGPFIGIVHYYNFKNGKPKNINFVIRWLNEYEKIKGLIYVIPSSEIDPEKHNVRGFYYNPKNTSENKWTYGTFPFPNAAFNRPFLPLGKKYDCLVNKIGDTCFNKKEPGKWEFYSWMKQNPVTEGLVPFTEKLVKANQVTTLLEKYDVLYLKKRYGVRGEGIYQIRQSHNGIEVINNKQEKRFFASLVALEQYLVKAINMDDYLVQQGVPFTLNGKNIDFRAYLQKDGTKKWQFRGVVARIATPGSIITNIRFTEKIMEGKKAFMHFFGDKENEAIGKIKRIEETCKQVGMSIDQSGEHYGDIALDFVFDRDSNIYFLEANSGYGHKSLRKIKNPKLRDEIMRTPMIYAKALAGFPT